MGVNGEQKSVKPDNLEVQGGGASDFIRTMSGIMNDTSTMQQIVAMCQEMLNNPHGAAQLQPMFRHLVSDPQMQRTMSQLPGGPSILAAMERMASNPDDLQQMLGGTFASMGQAFQDP